MDKIPLPVTTVTIKITVQIFHETAMATNAERQAAWRARQKELGANGRRWRIVDLTAAERDFLHQCLTTYRRDPEHADALARSFLNELGTNER